MLLRYALTTVRYRTAGFLGAFVALLCVAALITACGTLPAPRCSPRTTPTACGPSGSGRGRAGAEINLLAMGLVLAFTAIAVVNTLAMSTAERIREFALLRLAGATRRQVLRMLRTEALSVALIGAVLGAGIALAVLTAFSVGMTGRAAPTVLPLAAGTVVGLAALLALAATALPGRLALRVRPVELATAAE